MSEPPLATMAQFKDGTYDINDLADMHELLDVREENERLYNLARKKQEKN